MPGSSSTLPTQLSSLQFSGATALFSQTAWAYVPFLLFLPRNRALLAYCLKLPNPQSIPVLCKLKPCDQPVSIFWINHLNFLLPIIRRAHRKWEAKDSQVYTTSSCCQICLSSERGNYYTIISCKFKPLWSEIWTQDQLHWATQNICLDIPCLQQ